MSAVAQSTANAARSAGGKKIRLRDDTGRFVNGCAPGPGRPPTDPTMKALAIADRQHNFDFIRGLRDDRKADAELRFEAAKLLAQYSDGKPSLALGPPVAGPLVALQVNNGASVAGTGEALTAVDAVVQLAADDGSMPEEHRQALVASVFARANEAAARVAERRRRLAIEAQPEPASSRAEISDAPTAASAPEAIAALASPSTPECEGRMREEEERGR